MKKKDENKDEESKESLQKSTSNKQESKNFQLSKCHLILALISVLVAFAAGFIFQKSNLNTLHSNGAISFEAYVKFNEFDQNEDGYLSPKEFELAYFHLTKLKSVDGLGIKDVEMQNVSLVNFCVLEDS